MFLTERTPAWSSNDLKRLTRRPKRFAIDAGLAGSTAGLTEAPPPASPTLTGRVLETFVAAQLRAEAASVSPRARLLHIRDEGGRHEIDLVLELRDRRVIAVEVKAGATTDEHDARHLLWLRDRLGDQFAAGVVFHTGPSQYRLSERVSAQPIASLWS